MLYSKIRSISDTGGQHIAVLCGGMSTERNVSLSSSKSVVKSLLKQNYRVTEIDMGRDISSVIMQMKPDIVFNCLHGQYGEDGCIPAMLNILQIPYTNSGVLASSLSLNKEISQKFFQNLGIRVPKSHIVTKCSALPSNFIGKPYVIKPIAEGSSLGVEVIFPEDQYNFADYQFKYGNKVILEEYIPGQEIQVAVLNGVALGTLEIKLLKNRFYDYQTKYTQGYAEHLYPGNMSRMEIEEVKNISELANKSVKASGIVRAEFILSEDRQFYLLELNTHPGFTELSICPEIAAYNGINFDQLVQQLVHTARYDK